MLTGATVPVHRPPSTWTNLGLFQPDELCLPHPEESLNPYPTTKVCRPQVGGGWFWCTLGLLLSGLRPSIGTEFESVSSW